MEFGNRIKEQRKKLKLTQAEVANQLYITRQTISNWEQGKSYPDLDMLVKISNVYQISIDSLLKEDKHLKKYLEQGKAYNAFSIFRGLFFIMYGLFFLMINYLDTNSTIAEFYIYAFLSIFIIAILYGEHVEPFFLGLDKRKRKKTYPRSSPVGKIFLLIIAINIISMVISHNEYLEALLFFLVGLMNIFQKYMWKNKS
ncbi:XRE family transcriptional regulator [Lactobacillus sp. 0.1XD8-4]|uniref:helix-turn-helix domain-containing protein n=1 Tax=uncultured Limosilactobacillus sp. TaxID=2837629 RepID=UPI00129DF625|nr:helix-turn-helix transcriptional regulator [uncultured Limosilactobacillus sp.]MRN06662.1 XRE family transcriptional regulator [Lactobacillus sp. 0.1XD8-4]